ncbi:uncharacterized protein LOC131324406 isoform X2 [Rhododendron vialii]|uniref:uncharacterized protein LOC131324406 isoform X2 n=1 Tax=Rhododendron vialii TaxID=182163 RepID=UPI00265D7455|nr:uncharacterized protein LOC131324406 isoform X2 [Rhododendron vialii]
MGDPNPRRSLRCLHCAGPLSKEMETSDWNVPPLIRDSFCMIGTAVGGTTSAFYGFNHGSTCDGFLFSLCWVGRWCSSSTCPTCIFILPCSFLISIIAISILTGRSDSQITNVLYSIISLL